MGRAERVSDNHGLSQCLSLGVFSFSGCFSVKTPAGGAVDRMLRLRQQISHAVFHPAVLGTAITLTGHSWGLLAACPAPGHKRLGAWGSLGAVHSHCCGTRISPKPCWVSLGLSRAEPLLSGALIGEVRDVEIWKCLSCKNIPRNV